MQSINFNTGLKRYAINGDENNFIEVNVTDVNLLARIQNAKTDFDAILARLDKEEHTPQLIMQVDADIKAKLDEVFQTDISSKAFGNANCLSPLEDGNLLFVAFFEAFAPLILADINKNKEGFKANKDKKFGKYLPPAEKKKEPNFDLSKLTPEQIALLESFNK